MNTAERAQKVCIDEKIPSLKKIQKTEPVQEAPFKNVDE